MKTEKKSFISNINKKISSLSKTAILLIVIAYTTVLSILVIVAEPNPTYISIPSYEHVYFDEAINPQISIIANRTFNDEGKETLKYNISVSIYGRPNATSSSDPNYSIKNFKMSASLSDSINSSLVKKMYYFTEHNSYTTPIVHSYSIDNTSESQHPTAFYCLVQYKKNTVNGTATFKEDVMLSATSDDIAGFNNYYNLNENKEATSFNIFNRDGSKNANVQFTVKQSSTKENVYNCGVKISMETLSYSSKHHIDMQTWVETENGEFLPFIGVYGYTNQRSNYVQSGRELYKELKPKYICIKTVQYFGERNLDFKVDYFKQDLTKLSESFTSNPNVGDEIDDNVINNNPVVYVAIGCGVAIIATFVIVVVVYFFKKKEQAVVNTEESDEKAENKE